jgi:hypothetical protein
MDAKVLTLLSTVAAMAEWGLSPTTTWQVSPSPWELRQLGSLFKSIWVCRLMIGWVAQWTVEEMKGSLLD